MVRRMGKRLFIPLGHNVLFLELVLLRVGLVRTGLILSADLVDGHLGLGALNELLVGLGHHEVWVTTKRI